MISFLLDLAINIESVDLVTSIKESRFLNNSDE